ncbi:transposase [Amycolatopsis sp. NPDC051045]|uniref:IS110 family transposase n=1 Tax=Amycolatopsis sp. NPDC051045 TaxID=3156922 RepID=UPI003438FC7B
MPHPALPSQDGTSAGEVVLGVDTHKDLHVAAVITTLALLGSRAFATTRAGYKQLLTWARRFGPLQRAGVECTGSYGAALARHLHAEGVQVIEVNQPDKAARAVLSGRANGSMKAGDGSVEMLRMFKLAKGSAIKARTQTINQLKAMLIAADPTLREELTGLSNPILFRRCAELPPTTPVTSPAPRSTRFDCWPAGFVS